MADSTSVFSPSVILQYAAVFGVGYILYYASTGKNKQAAQAKHAKKPQAEPRKEDRKKKQRVESFASEEKARPKAPAKATEPGPFLTNTDGNDVPDDGVDNREFAKQLSKAKQGTQFNASSDMGKKKKEKSVKQSRANKISAPVEEKAAVPPASSSGDSADVDDDRSPARSPVAEATDAAGVADMLEPAAAAPSVLRLTDTEPKDKKKKKTAKDPEPVETKKQRQNRKKAEAARAAREESEKERRALEEKQRRAARIAEGRAAKDGSQFTAAAAAKNSAWNQGAPNGGLSQGPQDPGTNGVEPLLDTFEEPAAKAAQPKPSGPMKAESGWAASLPSEEEQLEMLKNESDEWSTVKTKASKRLAKKASSTASGDESPVQAAPEPKKPAGAAPAANTGSKANAPQSFGSFSALTSKDEPAEEVEEEWDV
ncbi:hypothetical protein ACRE_086680 [Hapsidospora chrysogenum ATCC 11550]|uniref:Uncharacterized protein n=1 Tax=Hapsidospora chrysogenum (strain ATCC 11550 / CBS 779.69 / DSM 880 / IAM 14645 / JCM 23072 / IMI 49137) TaxID=857340 RepID=A0A086SU44_HAPC1|nr:hypothetical protein ACRE_086680 [Hapsidospora chrysogenum ATCC 11550]